MTFRRPDNDMSDERVTKAYIFLGVLLKLSDEVSDERGMQARR